jgi:hypothetical protein
MATQLWRDLKPAEQTRQATRFVQLDPAGLARLPDEQFYLFAQWIYGRQSGAAASSIEESSGLADFIYRQPDGKQELLRVYATDQVPMAMLYAVLKSVEGLGYNRVSLYLRARKSTAEARLQQEFPQDFEVVDLDGLLARLAEAQRERPAPKRAAPAQPQPASPRQGKPARAGAARPKAKAKAPRRSFTMRRILLLLLIVVLAGLAVYLFVFR